MLTRCWGYKSTWSNVDHPLSCSLMQELDNIPGGPWCLVDAATCTGTPAGLATPWHAGWDYCNSTAAAAVTDLHASIGGGEAAPPTLSGCTCTPNWLYNGTAPGPGRGERKCSNTDGDPGEALSICRALTLGQLYYTVTGLDRNLLQF